MSQELNLEAEKLVKDFKVSAHNKDMKLASVNDQRDVQNLNLIKQSENIIESQKRLQREHAILLASVEQGMLNLQEAAGEAQRQLEAVNKIQKNIVRKQQLLTENLALELGAIQRKSSILGSSMTHLEVSVGDLTEKSLRGQVQLLSMEEEAMLGLTQLQRSQVEAIQESRKSFQDLAAEAYKHRQEFHRWQTELNDMHQRLINGSATMVKAQERFERKRGAVFTVLEKLFSLHGSILLASRALKTVVVYFAMAIVVFMATTAAKQTPNACFPLYFGLFVSFAFELWLIRFRAKEIDVQALGFVWPTQKILWVRGAYCAVVLGYLSYHVFAYRDNGISNCNLLKGLHGSIAGHTRSHGRLVEVDYKDRSAPAVTFSRMRVDRDGDIPKRRSHTTRVKRAAKVMKSTPSTRSWYKTT